MLLNNIRYLRRDEIDISKWDACITEATNGLVYACSTYLDGIANWHALVQNDYEAVMPLPWRQKFGFYYLYQPFFCQQLGVFSRGTKPISADQFLKRIPSFYSLWDIQLNAANTLQEFDKRLRKNYTLSLDKSYAELHHAFSRSAKRNIEKAVSAGVRIIADISPEQVIHLHQQRFGKEEGIPARDFQKLGSLLSKLHLSQRVVCVAATNRNGDIIASSAYLLFNDRLTFIMNGNLPESLAIGATHYLKDYVIRRFAASNLTMDFEGSDNPSFARFYEQFGASCVEYYPAVYKNKLPWPFRLFKKTLTELPSLC